MKNLNKITKKTVFYFIFGESGSIYYRELGGRGDCLLKVCFNPIILLT